MSALEQLVRQAMGSGVACFTDKLKKGLVNPADPLSEAFGDFPAEWLRIRSDLVDAVREELAAEL